MTVIPPTGRSPQQKGRLNLGEEGAIALKFIRFGGIAQLGERLVRNQKVGGSIPPVSTKEPKTLDT